MDIDLRKEGFKPIDNPGKFIPDCIYLSKRQTVNSNRAICVMRLQTLPEDMGKFLKSIRTKVAFKVGFFPLFWGLGLQVVLICPGATSLKESVSGFVDLC